MGTKLGDVFIITEKGQQRGFGKEGTKVVIESAGDPKHNSNPKIYFAHLVEKGVKDYLISEWQLNKDYLRKEMV